MDLMDLPVEPVEAFLGGVERMVENARKYRKPYPYPLMDLNIIYRMLGSPRAWQLGGEQVLLQLVPVTLAVVREWAAAALDETDADGIRLVKPGERYLCCPEPSIRFEGDMPELNLCDVELVEKLFWPVTMPVEFAESVSRLADERI